MRQMRIFAVLMIVMVLLSAFAAFGSFSEQEKNAGTLEFSVDQLLIKVLVKEGESYSSSIRIANGDNPGEFSVDVYGAAGMVGVSENKFFLNAGQSKAAVVEISSGGNDPGIYVGKISIKSGEKIIDVPVIVEIETKNVLFDTNINALPQNRVVQPGSDNTIEVRLFNLKDREMNSVTLEYSLKDSEGNAIMTETESVTVATQASFFKTLHIPAGMKEGQYVFGVLARYGKSSGTSSYFFDVVSKGSGTFASLPILYRNAALAAAAALLTIMLILLAMRRENREIGKEYEKEMGAYRQEALSRKNEIEEVKRRLEEDYRRKLAEELQRHGESKANIAKKIRDANAAMSGQIKRLETKTKKSVMRKISKFMKELGGVQKKMEDEKAAAQSRIAEERRQQEKMRKEKEEERKKIGIERALEKEKIRRQMEEEKKRLDARRLEQRKREAELRRKRMEAMKRKLKHNAFKFLHELGIIKTKKEILEEERKRRLKAEQELRIALERKREEESGKREVQRRIRELGMLEKRKEKEWSERKKHLGVAEKRHRSYEHAREESIKAEICRQKAREEILGKRKKQEDIEKHGRIINELKGSLQRMQAEEARRRNEEAKAVESLTKDYTKQLKEMEEKRLQIKPILAVKEAAIKAKYESLQRQFAKAEKTRRQEEKRSAKRMREREKEERERMGRMERQKMESLRAGLEKIEEEKRKELARMKEKERMERERMEKERSAEAKRQEKLRRLQRERYIRMAKARAEKIARKIGRGSFNAMHIIGLVHTEEEKRRLESIKERDRKEMERLKREKMRERERRENMAAGQREREKKLLEEKKRKRAEMDAEEKRRKERLKKLLGHRKELAKKEEYEARKRIEARLGAEKEAAKRRQADIIKESAALLIRREADYAALKGGLKNKLENLKKERERIGQEIKAGAERMRRAQQKTDREETERERMLVNGLKEKMEVLEKLGKKHIDAERLAKERLSQERKKIMRLKADSLLLRLGLKNGRKGGEANKR